MTFHPYQPATNCVGKAQPGTINLSTVIRDWPHANVGFPYGIYSCRLPSLHSEGRALDIGFPGVTDPEGTRLVTVLVGHAWELGLMGVIWNRTRWSARSPNGNPYTGVSPHTDHIHVEQTWDAARDLSVDAARRLIFEEDDGMTTEQIVSHITPEQIRALKAAGLFDETIDGYWEAKLANPADPEWEGFLVAVDINSKIRAAGAGSGTFTGNFLIGGE